MNPIFGFQLPTIFGAPATQDPTPPVLQITGTAPCAPAFKPLGDNSAWFVYHGIEVGLVVMMLIGILAVLFGNAQADQSAIEVAAL